VKDWNRYLHIFNLSLDGKRGQAYRYSPLSAAKDQCLTELYTDPGQVYSDVKDWNRYLHIFNLAVITHVSSRREKSAGHIKPVSRHWSQQNWIFSVPGKIMRKT